VASRRWRTLGDFFRKRGVVGQFARPAAEESYGGLRVDRLTGHGGSMFPEPASLEPFRFASIGRP
jgi:hypothetical protein